MKISRILICLVLAGAAVTANAQRRVSMTDIQVLEFVREGMQQDRDRQEMARELSLRGVDRAQLERVRNMYDEETAAKSVKEAPSADRLRTHSVNSGSFLDEEPDVVTEADGSVKVFGRDVFRNRKLNFAPSENLATPRNYTLGPGDEVIIDIFGANQTTLRSVISPEGSINVDVLGPVYLSGMTIAEANTYLKRKLSSIYRGLNRSSTGTDIRLSLGQIRSIQVNVLGDVASPGTYMVSSFATVFHLLYLAGGVVEPGSLRQVIVNRGGKTAAVVDVYDFLIKGSREGDVRLEEGDVVMVVPYNSLVKIEGKVKRPMYFEMKSGETLADLIDYAGGFASGAYTQTVNVVRQNGPTYEIRTVSEADFKDFALTDGDQVTVNELNSLFGNMIGVTGAVYQPGSYELGSDVNTVGQLVAKAGGLLPDAFTDRVVLHREHEDMTMEVLSLNLTRILSGLDPDVALIKNDNLIINSISDLRENGTMAISGMVKEPGVFPFAANTTVEDMIIMAGGLLDGASTDRVDISRRKRDKNGLVAVDEVGELISVSLSDGLVDGGGQKEYLQPYDEVIVHRSPTYNVQMHVNVTGEVNFAGAFTITNRNERLSDLVAKAGGVTSYAYLKGARLYRNISEDERRQLLDILKINSSSSRTKVDTLFILEGLEEDGGVKSSSGKVSADPAALYQSLENYQIAISLDKALAKPHGEFDIELRDGDVLDVPMIRKTVRVMGAVMMPTVLTYSDKMTPRQYIASCGGFAVGAKRSKAYVVHMDGSAERARGAASVQPGDEIVVPEKIRRNPDQTLSRTTSVVSSMSTLGVLLTSLMYLLK